jgi:hypothetical protein
MDIHDHITAKFPAAHRVLAETVALSVLHELKRNNALEDVVHRLRLDVLARDRRINELTASSQPAAGASVSAIGLDICSSDREFD